MVKRIKQLLARVRCRIKGCDFGDEVYVSPAVLVFCRHCGRELMGRTFDDLEPMTDEDYDYIEDRMMREDDDARF